MTEVEDENSKGQRGTYFVVRYMTPGGIIKTTSYALKKDMLESIRELPRQLIIGLFKGRQLEMTVKQVYQID